MEGGPDREDPFVAGGPGPEDASTAVEVEDARRPALRRADLPREAIARPELERGVDEEAVRQADLPVRLEPDQELDDLGGLLRRDHDDGDPGEVGGLQILELDQKVDAVGAPGPLDESDDDGSPPLEHREADLAPLEVREGEWWKWLGGRLFRRTRRLRESSPSRREEDEEADGERAERPHERRDYRARPSLPAPPRLPSPGTTAWAASRFVKPSGLLRFLPVPQG